MSIFSSIFDGESIKNLRGEHLETRPSVCNVNVRKDNVIIKNEITSGKTLEVYGNLEKAAKDKIENVYLDDAHNNTFSFISSESRPDFLNGKYVITILFKLNDKKYSIEKSYYKDEAPHPDDLRKLLAEETSKLFSKVFIKELLKTFNKRMFS
jgi:hypothetical protein